MQMRATRREREAAGKERREKEKWEKREKEKDRVVGGGLSYASGVRPLVRVATVNVGTVRYKVPTDSSL